MRNWLIIRIVFVSAITTNELIDAQQETSTPLVKALKNETLEEGDSKAANESEMTDGVKAFIKLLEEGDSKAANESEMTDGVKAFIKLLEESPEYKAQQALKSKLNNYKKNSI